MSEQSGRGTKSLPVLQVVSTGYQQRATSAARGRKRPAPPEEAEASIWTPGSTSSEPVDAEVAQEGPDTSFRNWYTERIKSVRDRFGGDTHQRRQRAEYQIQMDTDKVENPPGPGASDREHLLHLRASSRVAARDYLDQLRDSRILVPGFNTATRSGETDQLHQMHMKMMMAATVRPLSAGVSTGSIISAIGMYATMQVLSPDFREYTAGMRDKAIEGMQDWIERRRNSPTEKMMRRDQARGKGSDQGELLSDRWSARLDMLRKAHQGDRVPFTPHSAAMTEIGLSEQAFWRMREPGADAQRIHEDFCALRARLHHQMDADGLSREEVNSSMRTIIGERMAAEPEMATMYEGLSHGRLRRQMTAAPGQDKTAAQLAWTGKFEENVGTLLAEDGMFKLRLPYGPQAHRGQIGETMYATMFDSVMKGDIDNFRADVGAYMVGFNAQIKGVDTSGMPPKLAQRLDAVELMRASMEVDGIEPEDQRMLYSQAFADVINALDSDPAIQARYPGFSFNEGMASTFGPEWNQRMRDATTHPQDYFEAARKPGSRPGPQRQSADPRPTPETDYQPI